MIVPLEVHRPGHRPPFRTGLALGEYPTRLQIGVLLKSGRDGWKATT